MKKLAIIFALFLAAIPARASVSWVTSTSVAATSTTLSLTHGDTVFEIYNSTVATPAMLVGTDTPSRIGNCLPGIGGNAGYVCIYVDLSFSGTTGTQTVKCNSSCGTVNYFGIYEASGADQSSVAAIADKWYMAYDRDNSDGAAGNVTGGFHPTFSNDGVLTFALCSGSASTISATGITLGNITTSNGNVGAAGVLSTNAAVTATPGSGCNSTGSPADQIFFLGVKASSGATLSCTGAWDLSGYGSSTENGSSGSSTIAAYLGGVGDFVSVNPWALNGATVTTLTVGSDTPSSYNNTNSSSTTGQSWLYGDLKATGGGSVTITFTPGGTFTQQQVQFVSFAYNANYCTAANDVNSAIGTGSVTPATNPSITPTTGDLLIVANNSNNHSTAVGSPWACNNYDTTNTCGVYTTYNLIGYVLSAPSGATNNNTTMVGTPTYQAIISAYKLTASGGGATVVRRRSAGIF